MAYTAEKRADWLLMLEAAGYPHNPLAIGRVAKQKGAPSPRTLKRWWQDKDIAVRPPLSPAQIADEKRPDLIDAINNEIYAILGEMPAARSEAAYRELATAFGIFVDKRQLLTGQSTSNQDIRIVVALKHDDD